MHLIDLRISLVTTWVKNWKQKKPLWYSLRKIYKRIIFRFIQANFCICLLIRLLKGSAINFLCHQFNFRGQKKRNQRQQITREEFEQTMKLPADITKKKYMEKDYSSRLYWAKHHFIWRIRRQAKKKCRSMEQNSPRHRLWFVMKFPTQSRLIAPTIII